MMSNKNKTVVSLPIDASAWLLIAETIKFLHYHNRMEDRDNFHKQTLGHEENFTKAKEIGESFGIKYLPVK